MRTITKTLYTFEELSEDAKKYAIKSYIEDDDLSFINGGLSVEMSYKLAEYGYEGYNKDDLDICYSLGYCQGDGMAFYGKIDFEKWYKLHKKHFTPYENKRIKNEELYIGIEIAKINHLYDHAHSMGVDVTIENYENNEVLERIREKIYNIVDNEISDISGELEDYGYEYIEYCRTDEYVIEEFENGEYEFNEDGSRDI